MKTIRKKPGKKLIRCLVYLIKEDEGGFSVLAANLPGAASQGDTQEEALANIVDAIEGVMAAYHAAGEEVPWTEEPRPKDFPHITEHWVVVHAEPE